MASLEQDRTGRPAQFGPAFLSYLLHLGRLQTHKLAPFLVIALLLGAWEAGARLGFIAPLFFPAPTRIARAALEMWQAGTLPAALGTTLARVGLGILLGGVPGLLLGLIMGWSGRARLLLDPLVAALHPVPKIAILPLIMIVLGIGEPSKIFVAALGAFFPMLINTMAGVREIHPIHFEVAANCNASPRLVLSRIVLPGSLPMMLAGLLIALNTTLLLTIAVEMVAAREGLGATIWLAWELMYTEDVYACLLVITALGIAFNAAIAWLTRRIAPWRAEDRRTV
jgi:NitT/TauT family transport system permease protein